MNRINAVLILIFAIFVICFIFIQSSAFNQARMTIDCFKKECDILRNALAEAQAIMAQQELDNLKLQKSICEYNDTINASQLNETASILMANNTQYYNNNNGPLVEMATQLDKANAELEIHASKLKVIATRLFMVTGIKTKSPSTDIDECLEKLLSVYNEYIDIERFMNSHKTNNVPSASQSIMERIRSQYDRNAALQQNNELMSDELMYVYSMIIIFI